jgi:hypothetical protein
MPPLQRSKNHQIWGEQPVAISSSLKAPETRYRAAQPDEGLQPLDLILKDERRFASQRINELVVRGR